MQILAHVRFKNANYTRKTKPIIIFMVCYGITGCLSLKLSPRKVGYKKVFMDVNNLTNHYRIALYNLVSHKKDSWNGEDSVRICRVMGRSWITVLELYLRDNRA